jgi:hypothetical protein
MSRAERIVSQQDTNRMPTISYYLLKYARAHYVTETPVAEQIKRERKVETIRAAIAGSASCATGRPCDYWVDGLCRLAGSYYEPHSQDGCGCWSQAGAVAKALDDAR